MSKKPTLPVSRFWMRNDIATGDIEVLAEVNGTWLTVFSKHGPGPVARDKDQIIDHVIHSGGIQSLLDHDDIHGATVSERICASCGHPEKPHRYRHLFVLWRPGMPAPPDRKRTR